MIPAWYHPAMAMTLRLTDDETAALRSRAEKEGRSMQDIARTAINEYLSQRPNRLRGAIDRVRAEDAELLERLGR
jgi:predicted transcriptional regulator